MRQMAAKNKKIAFLIPYYEGRNHSPFLGVGYLSQVLKDAGFDTLILDEDAIYFVMENRGIDAPLQASRRFILNSLQEYSPVVVGMTVNTTNYERCLQLLRTVRKYVPETCIIVGGPHISTSWFSFKKHHSDIFDIAIIGEGESTILEVCNRVLTKASLKGISGTVLSHQAQNVIQPRALVANLDTLPYPDRDGFFYTVPGKELSVLKEHYRRVFYSHLPGFRGKHYERIVGSRGCNYSCNFCSPSVFWRNPITDRPKRRIRHPKNIVNEIEYLFDRGYEAFYFDDPTFPFSSEPDFINTFIHVLEQRGLKIAWAAPTRYDELSKNILVKLARTGFTYTYFGLETYRRKDLLKMGKEMDINHCLKLIEWCNDLGIHCDVSYQIGIPGDDYESIIQSIQWLEEHGLQKRSFFSIAAVWPETPLARKYGLSSENYEPECRKTSWEKQGLYHYKPGNPQIEKYYSNCSGTFHFIDIDTAIRVKDYLMDVGFIKRFGDIHSL